MERRITHQIQNETYLLEKNQMLTHKLPRKNRRFVKSSTYRLQDGTQESMTMSSISTAMLIMCFDEGGCECGHATMGSWIVDVTLSKSLSTSSSTSCRRGTCESSELRPRRVRALRALAVRPPGGPAAMAKGSPPSPPTAACLSLPSLSSAIEPLTDQ